MSMIGHSLLNQIVIEQGILDPAEILNEMNRKILESLHRGNTNVRDGMDMSLVVIDQETNQLEFAGAKNPLLLIQNGEITFIKGDKAPIGGSPEYYKDIQYTRHSIQLEEDAAFYLFSDGYPDQFGGKENRKFMLRRLRNTIFEIHQSDMDTQHEVLDSQFETWKGKYNQLDDVLLIGGRIQLETNDNQLKAS
jgi:serine phosphatase RsbU (regulator of sigma subunit)